MMRSVGSFLFLVIILSMLRTTSKLKAVHYCTPGWGEWGMGHVVVAVGPHTLFLSPSPPSPSPPICSSPLPSQHIWS